MSAQHITVDATPFEYFETGRGSLVVFVHGAPSDSRVWIPHAKLISASHYRALIYTQRYFGRQKWDDGWPPFGVQTHADDLIALISRLGGEPAHVVAWSYGGHVALTAAGKRPDLFKSLFIYEPGVPTYVVDPGELSAFAADADLMFGPVFAAVKGGDNASAVRMLLDGSGNRPGYFASQPVARQAVQLDNARTVPKLLTQTPPPTLSCDELARLGMPAAITWGEQTRPLFSIVSRAAARCIRGTAHGPIPAATHMWPEEDPDGFVSRLVLFLKHSESALSAT